MFRAVVAAAGVDAGVELGEGHLVLADGERLANRHPVFRPFVAKPLTFAFRRTHHEAARRHHHHLGAHAAVFAAFLRLLNFDIYTAENPEGVSVEFSLSTHRIHVFLQQFLRLSWTVCLTARYRLLKEDRNSNGHACSTQLLN